MVWFLKNSEGVLVCPQHFSLCFQTVVLQSIQERERGSSRRGCGSSGQFRVPVTGGAGQRRCDLPGQCGGNRLPHHHDQRAGDPRMGWEGLGGRDSCKMFLSAEQEGEEKEKVDVTWLLVSPCQAWGELSQKPWCSASPCLWLSLRWWAVNWWAPSTLSAHP